MIAARIDDATIAITDAYKQREAVAVLGGARWVPALKAWLVDATAANVASIAAVCPLDEELRALLPVSEPQRIVEDSGEWLTDATPYEHQRHAVAACMDTYARGGHGFALLMEMGCGKTLSALEVVARLHAADHVHRVLVVAPGSVVPVWAREVEFLRVDVELRQLLGSKKKRVGAIEDMWSGALQIAVINYESAWRLGDELIGWGPDMVIADESQRIKGHASKQTKGVTRIGKTAVYRLALSGTPVTNGPLDVFAQWRYLDRSIFGDSYYAFRARYAIMGGFEGKQVVGFKALDELIAKAHRIAYRVTKAEALDLPETTDVIVPVVLGAPARKAYDALKRDSVAAFDDGETSVTNVLTRLLRLQQIASGAVPMDDGTLQTVGTEKMDAACEVIDDALGEGGKVVVFARFRAEVDAMCKRYDGVCAALHGDIAQDDRGEEVRRFQEDADCRVMVAQLQVGGAGITLHAASTMVFVSLGFNYGDYEQAKARIHRIGQTQKCTYVHIVAQDTVDETIIDAMQRKADVATLIVDRGINTFR